MNDRKTDRLLAAIESAPSLPSVSIRALGLAFADIDHAIAKHNEGRGKADAIYDAIERAQTHMVRMARLLAKATEQADHAAEVDEDREAQGRRPEVIRGWFKKSPAIRIFGIGIGARRGIGHGVIDATKMRQAEPIDRAACIAAEANARAVEKHDDEAPLVVLGQGVYEAKVRPQDLLDAHDRTVAMLNRWVNGGTDESGFSAGAGGAQ